MLQILEWPIRKSRLHKIVNIEIRVKPDDEIFQVPIMYTVGTHHPKLYSWDNHINNEKKNRVFFPIFSYVAQTYYTSYLFKNMSNFYF